MDVQYHFAGRHKWKGDEEVNFISSSSPKLKEKYSNNNNEHILLHMNQKNNSKFVEDRWNVSHDSLKMARSLSVGSFGKKEALFYV